MNYVRTAALGVGLVVAGAAVSAPEQPVTGPVAEYWMSAATTSGMAGMSSGGGRPDMQAMMSGGAVSHVLILQLGSARHPDGGPPAAEHDPPQGLGAGPVLPLVTPTQQPSHQEAAPGPPSQYQQPHGKMLIFWGCGEHAGPGQPFVIDFATMATGGAQKFMDLQHALAIAPMQPPSPQRNATYGEWPNAQSNTTVPPQGSLQGDHTVKGNYTPDIHFSLTADQDFLPPIQMTANQRNPSGSATLGWRRVDGAQGYFADMIGAQGQDQVVMWTSSAVEASSFGLPDYLSDHEIARLVGSHVLMPADQTSCTIPQEAVQAAGHSGFYNLVGYGGETNLSYPERPPAPQPWHILWTVKVRYRSATSGIVGMDMSHMGGGYGGQGGQGGYGNQGQPPPQQQRPRPNPFNPFGGYLP
ncbi:MAG TPA: hypothetical protein VGL58_03435 [Caulobacteraceae bacterium]|jgi:hypothetical protein